jgi:hypothetical protein
MNLHDLGQTPSLPETRRSADLARLRAAMRDDPRREAVGRARWTRRGFTFTAATVIALGGGAAAAAVVYQLAPQHATVSSHGRCYWQVSDEFGDDFPGTTAATDADDKGWTPDVVATLVDGCAAIWRAGAFQEGKPGIRSEVRSAGDYPVPPLVACVLPGGEAAVFPGDPATCADLGLPALLQ